jgi:glycosyltransferase involved in cell wall biosynthesis
VVTDGVDGFLVPEGDIEALASKLTTVIEDDVLRQQMGQAARIASERYAEDVVMKKWIDLFERVKG